MALWPRSYSFGSSVAWTEPEVQVGQMLFSSSSAYSVLEFIGEGCFGKVARCQNLATKQIVAVKIIKQTDVTEDIQHEVSMLELISVLNPDRTNMVKFFEQFEHKGLACLAFEMLGGNLYNLLKLQEWTPLTLNEIRPIAKQMFVALDALKELGILHTDIKPDNIMFVNMQDQGLRVKLIDFGLAISASDIKPGMELQPGGYRAPEIALGLPFTEVIDVWGIGCILAFLFLAENLFPVDCDYQMMKCMVDVLGLPQDHHLCTGKYTKSFFSEEESDGGPIWRLMTSDEYQAANNVEPKERNSFIDLPSSLDEFVNIYLEEEAAEMEDRRAFVDLMKQLLHLDGDQRISAHQALQQPFIKMTHLAGPDSRTYLTTAQTMMRICSVDDLSDRVSISAASQSDQGSAAGLPSSAKDGPSDIRPLDVYDDNGPIRGSSDGVSGYNSYYEDPTEWHSDGEVPPYSYDSDPDEWLSDGEVASPSYYKGPAAWPSDGEVPPYAYDTDLDEWPSDGEVPSPSYDKSPAPWPSDGEIPSPSYDKSPAPWPSDGEVPPYSYDTDLDEWPSDGEVPSPSYDKSPAAWPSDGAHTAECTDEVSACCTKNLLKRFCGFFKSQLPVFAAFVPLRWSN